ncbi:hypothetical protein HDU83_008688 [Entophlyctis luteolus]|nr:hypothetical protein HDU82_004164 [Entophlyctis luteolus]KAJ3351786.1 hypothetical protein HDU83_008688 [Entophlyctis luteolus]
MPEFLKNSRNDFLLSPNSSINSDSIEEKSFSPSKASALFADNTHQTSTNCDIIGVVDSWSPNYLGKTRSIKQEKHENPIPSLQPLMFDALIQTEEWMIGQTRKNSAFAISNEDNNIRVHTDRLVAVSQNLSTIAKSLHDLNSKLVTKCEFPLQRERNISLEQEKISSDAKTSKPHNQPTIFRDNSTNEEEQALLFSDLDPTTIDTIERLLPTDNSLLFANDTSMVKPLRDVVRDVERLRMTNPMDDGWQAVEMEVSERRTELRASLERREIVDEIKRQNSMSSSFESTKSLKSSLKGSSGNSYHKKSPKMTADMDILIARMNMASSPAH